MRNIIWPKMSKRTKRKREREKFKKKADKIVKKTAGSLLRELPELKRLSDEDIEFIAAYYSLEGILKRR